MKSISKQPMGFLRKLVLKTSEIVMGLPHFYSATVPFAFKGQVGRGTRSKAGALPYDEGGVVKRSGTSSPTPEAILFCESFCFVHRIGLYFP